MNTENEQRADNELKKAWEAIHRAQFFCEEAGYGSQVLAPLDEALKQINYAWDTTRGRN